MPVRIGIMSVAHGHAGSYVHSLGVHPDAELVGVWDNEPERGRAFAERAKIPFYENVQDLFPHIDAVCLCSENKHHAWMAELAADAGKHILCEKPLVTTPAEEKQMREAVERNGVMLSVAFPCRFSPAYQRLKERVRNGEIGKVLAISATNHGMCPFGWFVEPEKSGGGAMVDHTVHVGDLLRDLLQEDPVKVTAHKGNNMYGQVWDDTAMVTLEYASGIFATIDSSWSRPKCYKTWGDVTMHVVGEKGVIELDMFGQEVLHFHPGEPSLTSAGFGTNTDALLVDDFIQACLGKKPLTVRMEDGLAVCRIFMGGYESVERSEPVAIG